VVEGTGSNEQAKSPEEAARAWAARMIRDQKECGKIGRQPLYTALLAGPVDVVIRVYTGDDGYSTSEVGTFTVNIQVTKKV